MRDAKLPHEDLHEDLSKKEEEEKKTSADARAT